jgi:hypothetical protein
LGEIMKNFTILMLFMLLSSCSSVLVADEWPEKECAEYHGETLEQADAANKAEEMDRAEELFEASLVFSQMAANHTVVYAQFCD